MSLPPAGNTAPPATHGHDDGLPTPRRHLATGAILAGIALAVLDGAIANVALPTIAHALQVSPALAIWVVTGYQVALVMALLPCAALGESYGYHRVFRAGVMLFTAASVGCALAPTLPWLVVARFVQGFGGAALMAPMAALLRFTHPAKRLGSAIGWNALTVALSSAIGPTLGATILSVASWPWLFAVNLPVGVVVLLAARALPRSEGTQRPLDVISVLLNAGVFAPIVVGVDLMASHAAASVALFVAAGACLTALVRREMPRQAPLIPIDLLRVPAFRLSVIASICCFGGQMLSFVALPFYLQHGLGLSTLKTGLYLTPWPLAVAFAAPLAAKLAYRFPTAWLCAIGGAFLATGLALAAAWPLHQSLLPLVLFTIISGLGFGFFQTPNNRNMILSAPRERTGAAGGMQASARLIGQTIGAVIMGLLFSLAPAATAPRIGLAVAAALALAGGLVSLLRAARQ